MDTEATFHLLMSSLNVGLLANRSYMLLTAAVSQPAMLPYVAAAVVGLVIHAVTAVAMFAFEMAVCVLGSAVLGSAVLHPQTAHSTQPWRAESKCKLAGWRVQAEACTGAFKAVLRICQGQIECSLP